MPEETKNIASELLKVEFSEKKMKAFLVIKEQENTEPIAFTEQDIESILKESGIIFGINQNLFQEITNRKEGENKFLAARGICPIPGEETKFAFNFPTEKSLRPRILENGHIDYKEINVVYSVDKDAALVKKIPATEGTKGTNVLGELVPAPAGRDLNITPGPGTYKDAEDPSIIKSSIEGIIFYDQRKRKIEVQQLYRIPYSVGYSTGNIHVKSSVEIKGDIEPGFTVTTPYNVQVKGAMELAEITCGGILTVKDGITGDGKQIINTGGDIHTGYINNINIKCSGSVYVSNEIRNANIVCEDEVLVIKPSGIILGGKVTATNKVSAAFIGNNYGVPTEIEVGIVPKYREDYLRKSSEKAFIQKHLDDLKQRISLIANKSPEVLKESRLSTYKEQWNECSEQFENAENELKDFESIYYNVSDPAVYVLKKIYPGVIIKIKHLKYEVQEELSHVMFKISDDEIIYSKIS